MPGLVPGIHVLSTNQAKDVDGRDKPGHDEVCDVAIAILGCGAMELHDGVRC
jgi:hypothetical protein